MSSAFEYVQGNERLDWGVLVSIDVQRLMKDTNVDTLQRIVENLAFSRITRDEAALFTPDHILQLFQLSQLVTQYLVYSQECLAKMNLKLNERLEDLQGAQREIEESRRTMAEENAALKKEVKAQRRTLLAYEYNAAAGGRPSGGGGGAAAEAGGAGQFICSLCGEAYHKQESLQSHMRKRHYGVPAPPPAAYYPAAQPAPPPPPLPKAGAAGPTGSGGGDDLERMQARVQQLEAKLERDREAMDRQRDQMMFLLLAKGNSAAPASVPYTSQTPPSPQQQQPQQQGPANTTTGTVTPAFESPLRTAAASSGEQLLPSAIASIPIVPDTERLMEYNYSKQRELANNTLARQIQDLEKEIRDLRGAAGAGAGSGSTPVPLPSAGAAPTPDVSAPTPAGAPSWLSSMGLPALPTGAPTVNGVSGQPAAPATSDAQREQELANYLKYGPSGPAFVPPPVATPIPPNPSNALPPPPAPTVPSVPVPSIPAPRTHTPDERGRAPSRRHSRVSSYSYSYSTSSSSRSSSGSHLAHAYRPSASARHHRHGSSSRRRRDHSTTHTASPPVPSVPAASIPLATGALSGVPPPPPPIVPTLVSPYETQPNQQSTPDRRKEKKEKKDKKSRHSSKHKDEEPSAPPRPALEGPLSAPSSTPSAPMSYAAMLQQYQDQLLRPSATVPGTTPVPTAGASTPLQLSTVGSPPLAVPTAGSGAASPPQAVPSLSSTQTPLSVPGVGHNYSVAPVATGTYSTSATLAAPRSNVPAWLRTQESRDSSTGSTSSTSTVPPNRAVSGGPAVPHAAASAPLSVPPLSINVSGAVPVPSAYGSQTSVPVPSTTNSTQNTGPLSVPSAGAAPVPSPYANTSYMTGGSATTVPNAGAIPAPPAPTGVVPIPVPSPYYSTAALPPTPSLPQPGQGAAAPLEVKPLRPRMSSSDSSSSRYSY